MSKKLKIVPCLECQLLTDKEAEILEDILTDEMFNLQSKYNAEELKQLSIKISNSERNPK